MFLLLFVTNVVTSTSSVCNSSYNDELYRYTDSYQLYKLVIQEYRIFCFACADPFALIHYVQLQFAVHLKRLLHTLTVKQVEIQAESERFAGERAVSSGS